MTTKETTCLNGRLWTEQELNYLKNYPEMTEQEISKHLGRSKSSVSNKLVRLGYKQTDPNGRRWTEKEENYLQKYYEIKDSKEIAKRLNRTVDSVRRKASSMHLTLGTEYLTMKLLCRAFQIDLKVVHRWQDQYDMPMTKVVRGTQVYYRIDEKEFWKWAKEHEKLLPWYKYQIGSLTQEPDNISELKNKYQIISNRWTAVSGQCRKRITERYRNGQSVYKIAADEQRTPNAIRHIIEKTEKMQKQRRELKAQF